MFWPGCGFFSALFAYLAVKCVHGLDRVWKFFRARNQPASAPGDEERPSDPGRRYFFKTATRRLPAQRLFSELCMALRPSA